MGFVEKLRKLDKFTRYSAVVISIFALVILYLTAVHHVSGDACWYMSISRFISNNRLIPFDEPLGRDMPFWSPPLFHIMAASVFYAFGNVSHSFANFAVKFISPFFGIGSLFLSFAIIKKLFDSKIAFYSIVFLAFIPIFVDYSIFSYVESTLVFFVILSLYFVINGRIVLGGIAAGLSVLVKYNGIFILPALVYFIYLSNAKKRIFFKKSAVLILLALIIPSPWFIRNLVLLGNPVWPFLNFIFHGYSASSYGNLQLSNLVDPDFAIYTYLGFFGVPDCRYAALTFFKIPYFGILLPLWLLGTFVFIMPLLIGFFRIGKLRIKNSASKVKVNFLLFWIIAYIFVLLLYVVNAGFAVSRMILPAFPAIAVFWAFGYEKIANSKCRKLAIFCLFIIIIGLIFAETIKITLASREWGKYKEDFDWIKQNTPEGAIFMANGQCFPYNIERLALYSTSENIRENLENADYIWVNQNFKLDTFSSFDKQSLSIIQSGDYKAEYRNKKTGTIIYSIRR